MFVADFIGSPPMNFLGFQGGLASGSREIVVQGSRVAVPELREDLAPAEMALGIRPEHIRFDDDSDLRGSIFGAEYLGTTQIVTVDTADGIIKARIPAEIRLKPGETVGLALRQRSGYRCSTKGPAERCARRSTIGRRRCTMAEVRLTGVTKCFGATVAVDRLDLTIADGEFVVLLGPTGAGKTTTLRLIAGLEPPDAGAVISMAGDATALSPAARDTAFVFQQYSLYPHLSVFDNLAFPLRSPARRIPRKRCACASRRSRGCCASITSWTTARPGSRAARCSASPSAAPWCAGPPST